VIQPYHRTKSFLFISNQRLRPSFVQGFFEMTDQNAAFTSPTDSSEGPKVSIRTFHEFKLQNSIVEFLQ